MATTRPPQRLPVEPLERLLVELLAERGLAMTRRALSALLGDTNRRAVYYARAHGGYSIRVADRMACQLGRHPAELWPEWFGLPAAIDCGTRAGWREHRRNSEEPCEPCRAARRREVKAKNTAAERRRQGRAA